MSIGIYKIVNPKGKIYIGQSINIQNRTERYQKYPYIAKPQSILYNSFKKYGPKNHTFEIIEECKIEDLNKRERYWQEHYNVLKEGLNCKLTKTKDKSGKLSQEIKDKIGKANKGNICPHKGKNLSNIHKKRIGESNKGKSKPKGFIKILTENNNKPVLQFNKNGDLLNEYKSYSDAKNKTGIDCQFALNKTAKTSKGFIWIYKQDWDGGKPIIKPHGNIKK